jgi:hypothetical protein
LGTPLVFDAATTRPVLMLGLVGFTHEESRRIQSQLRLAPAIGGVQWRIGAFAGADAWLVNGARARLLAEDEVEVDSPPPDSPVRFWLPEVDRPIAFSVPLGSREFEPACTFDAASDSSLYILLAKFSQWLRPRAMLLCVVDLLVRQAGEIRKSRVYHLMAENRLVGVVDLKREIGVLPEATLAELARAAWSPRPDAAAYIPENFSKGGTSELLWEFAGRTRRELLPARYRTGLVSLRRAPLVAQRLFTDVQLLVLRELSASPRTLAELCATARVPAADVVRALGAFYLVGSIRSPARPLPAESRHDGGSSWPSWLSPLDETTAPAGLASGQPPAVALRR